MKYFAAAAFVMASILPAYAGGHHSTWGNPSEFYAGSVYDNAQNAGTFETTGDIYTAAPSFAESGAGPLYVKFVPRDTHYADIVFFNTITGPLHDQVHFIREYDGIVVKVVLEPSPGANPDKISVIPPPGYVAIPAEISVKEGAVGTIEIHQAALS